MNEKVQNLIIKYEKHLSHGESILQKLKHLGYESGIEHQQQSAINAIWRMILNDFATLTDTDSYDSKEK